MRALFILLISLIGTEVFPQNNEISSTSLTTVEANTLNLIFEKRRKDFSFLDKQVAYTVGTSGTQLENKIDFFDRYLTPVVNKGERNVCALILLTKEEKMESGGIDAIVMSPAKIFTVKHRKMVIQELKKLQDK